LTRQALVTFEFYKYQACGNDFVLVDLTRTELPLTAERLESGFWLNQEAMSLVCDRRFGVGADGVLLLLPPRTESGAFYLHYLNADGGEGSLCGNGSRCAAAFGFSKGYFGDEKTGVFEASDGTHRVWRTAEQEYRLSMNKPGTWNVLEVGVFIHTGSPHLVVQVRDLVNYPVLREGKLLREHALFGSGGTNVNFMEVLDTNRLRVRTYERGVENETLSCGTGAVACVLLYMQQKDDVETIQDFEVLVQFRGGLMKVGGQYDGATFTDLYLAGPANGTFKGLWPGIARSSYSWAVETKAV
jgi:diaminopimelate epimerase